LLDSSIRERATMSEHARHDIFVAASKNETSWHLFRSGANLVTTVKRGPRQNVISSPVPIHEIVDRWTGKYEHRDCRRVPILRKIWKREDKRRDDKVDLFT